MGSLARQRRLGQLWEPPMAVARQAVVGSVVGLRQDLRHYHPGLLKPLDDDYSQEHLEQLELIEEVRAQEQVRQLESDEVAGSKINLNKIEF